MKRALYPLGMAQWRILNLLLRDGGALSTNEIAETLFPNKSRDYVGNKLRALERRGLVNKEVVTGASRSPRRNQAARAHHRSPKEAMWSIRVAREPDGWQPEPEGVPT